MIKNTKIKEKISHPNMFIGGNNLYQSRNKSVDGVAQSPKDQSYNTYNENRPSVQNCHFSPTVSQMKMAKRKDSNIEMSPIIGIRFAVTRNNMYRPMMMSQDGPLITNQEPKLET